jgi:hypothetical protein
MDANKTGLRLPAAFSPPMLPADSLSFFARFRAFRGLLCCLLGYAAFADDASPTPEAVEGAELAAELRAARPTHSFTNAATLRLRDAEGRRKAIPVTIRTLVADGSADWNVIYEARSEKGTETLTITHHGDGVPSYELARSTGTGPASAPRTLTSDETATPFAGSDFWACDLGLGFLHWPDQRTIRRDKPEMRKGRPCRILESIRPAGAGYVRVRSWIDLEHRQPLISEAYDPAGKLVKEFSVGSVKKVDGVWQLKDMEITGERDGTLTKLEFDLTVAP